MHEKSKNTNDKRVLSCTRCGSRNVKMTDVMPGDSWAKRLMTAGGNRGTGAGGTKFLVCKDCGNVTVVQVL